MTITFTDGGIETRIIYEFKYAMPLSQARAIGTASDACGTIGSRLARSRIEGERITSLPQRTR
jgi:hypothetical protein